MANTKKAIIFHRNCSDGITAAWVAYTKFGLGPDIHYISADYQDKFPKFDEPRDIYILDFSYPREVLEEQAKIHNIVIIDHHDTAREVLADLPYAIFDMKQSGCGLAWTYFFPNQPKPKLVQFVEDNDLWKFIYPETKPFSHYFNMVVSLNVTPEVWSKELDNLHDDIETQWEKIYTKLETLDTFYNKQLEKVIDRYLLVQAFGQVFPIVNATSLFVSSGGNELAKQFGMAAIYSIKTDMSVNYSLRSIGKELHVGHMAKLHGGGGHPNAAAFKIKIGDNPEYPILPKGWNPLTEGRKS